MFALVESGKITQMPKGNIGITLNGIQYPKSIYTLWSEAERNAIGIYTVEIDNTNKKNEEWYTNTDITYAFGSGKVTGTYGTAKAKKIADTLWTEQDKTDGKIKEGEDVGDVATEGLKTIKKKIIDNQCAGLLKNSDWMVIRATETGTTLDSGWKTWRASVRTKCNSMQTEIDNASDVAALATLFERNESGVRPLGDFPKKG